MTYIAKSEVRLISKMVLVRNRKLFASLTGDKGTSSMVKGRDNADCLSSECLIQCEKEIFRQYMARDNMGSQ